MSRILRVDAHDDGVNAWSMVHQSGPPAFAGLIGGYCDYAERTRGFTIRRELPHAEGVLIFNLGNDVFITSGDGREIRLRTGEGFIAGIHLQPAFSRSSGAQAGVQIDLPLSTLRRLTGEPMDRLRDRVVPLHDLAACELRTLGQRLCQASTREQRLQCLDTAFCDRFDHTRPVDRRQLGALELLRRFPDLEIAEVARKVGWSRKHLADRTRDLVGVGPRSFRRLLRFQGVVRSLADPQDGNWAAVAVDSGYYDQSHLIGEFREFAGMTPGEYIRRSLRDRGGLVEG